MEQLVEDVLQPIQKYYETVRDKCNTQQQQYVNSFFDIMRDHEDDSFQQFQDAVE